MAWISCSILFTNVCMPLNGKIKPLLSWARDV
jgi:hypothetical protein